jgi:hypothetical protein
MFATCDLIVNLKKGVCRSSRNFKTNEIVNNLSIGMINKKNPKHPRDNKWKFMEFTLLKMNIWIFNALECHGKLSDNFSQCLLDSLE